MLTSLAFVFLVGLAMAALYQQLRLPRIIGMLWLTAEVILFVLVGAAVDIRYTLAAGIPAVAMILLALVFRACPVAAAHA